MTEEEKKHQKELWKQDRIRARHEEWNKIRSMGTGAKLQYFWDYYKIVLVIAASILLIAYLAVTIIHGSRTRTLLYACFLNADELDPDTETLQADYIAPLGGLDQNKEIIFDSSIRVNPKATGTSQQDVAASIKITAYTGAGTLDVFLAPPDVTAYEQEGGMLLELEDLLTQEEIERLQEAGCLYYAQEPETDQDTGAVMKRDQMPDDGQQDTLNTQPQEGMHIYAVRIDPAGVIGGYPIYAAGSQVWVSLVGNTSRSEEAMRFLRFLLAQEESSTEQAK